MRCSQAEKATVPPPNTQRLGRSVGLRVRLRMLGRSEGAGQPCGRVWLRDTHRHIGTKEHQTQTRDRVYSVFSFGSMSTLRSLPRCQEHPLPGHARRHRGFEPHDEFDTAGPIRLDSADDLRREAQITTGDLVLYRAHCAPQGSLLIHCEVVSNYCSSCLAAKQQHCSCHVAR